RQQDTKREVPVGALGLETGELDVESGLANKQNHEPPAARTLRLDEVTQELELRQCQSLSVVDGDRRRSHRSDTGPKRGEEGRAPRHRRVRRQGGRLSVMRPKHLGGGPKGAGPENLDTRVLQVKRGAVQEGGLPGSRLSGEDEQACMRFRCGDERGPDALV